ncbi:MAG: FMN-binding protein [Oscillospiraceae bacterium]|nr:FMN-binding protein [Oscillospiraceae bacterium]
MNKKTFQEYIKPVVVLVVICLVSSFILASVNQVTAPIIDQQKNAAIYAAMQELLPDAVSFKKLDCAVTNVSAFYEDEGGSGYVAVAYAKGFHSDVTATVAMDASGAVLGIRIDASGETSTIGAKIAESSYADTYIGVSGSADGVDVLSGATVSSKALKKAVNAALTAFDVVVNGAAYDQDAQPEGDAESSATAGATADAGSSATWEGDALDKKADEKTDEQEDEQTAGDAQSGATADAGSSATKKE